AYSVLHNFGGSGDGSRPAAGLISVKGTLYGTTEHAAGDECDATACGTVFAITTSGTETILYTFFPEVDGADPKAGLVDINGTFYGTAYQAGGYATGFGTVVAITGSRAETTLHSFTGHHSGKGDDGAYPAAGLVNVNGTLYGTTYRGGNGTVH